MINTQKALATNAYDVLVNGIAIERKDTKREAVAEAKRLANKSGMSYDGFISSPSKSSQPRSEFKGKYRAIPKGWQWGEKI